MQDHWTKKHKRKKDVKRAIIFFLNGKKRPELPCHITLTRIAPRSLDSADNLGTALKSAIDTIADWLIPGMAPGRADGDPRLTFHLNQRKGETKEYALEIEIKSF